MKLLEYRELAKGIFWVKDADNIEDTGIFLDIPCTSDGNALDNNGLNSKNGTTYNHERTWPLLGTSITGGKPYNYYPRGRVEISNGKATIFANPHIASDELLKWCVDKFNLTAINGIKKVRVVADGSDHYKCYLDKE